MGVPELNDLQHLADTVIETVREAAGTLAGTVDAALDGGDKSFWLLSLLAVAAGLGVASRFRLWRRTDPVRWFDYTQRAIARARAGYRCEYTSWWSRCKGKAEETDHFYPHARGGATTVANAVAVCRKHNQGKGGAMPSAWTRWRIWWRRRTYYPTGVTRMPGQWYEASRRGRR